MYLPTLTFAWDFSNYVKRSALYRDQIIRSFTYAAGGGSRCACCWHSRWPTSSHSRRAATRTSSSGLVILPFFVTFLIRTIAWKTILADDGWVVSALGAVGLLPGEGRLLSTSWAVIGGLTYNWIIFMILPLYVSLEKIDPRLHRGVEGSVLIEHPGASAR